MCTKVNNFLVRVLLRALLSLHLLESFRVQLNEILDYYRLFRHGDCAVSISDLHDANLLREHFEKVYELANGFRASVYSRFGDLPEPCNIEISFPKGLTPPVHIYSRGYSRISFPGLSAEFYDLFPGDQFSISFNEPDKE